MYACMGTCMLCTIKRYIGLYKYWNFFILIFKSCSVAYLNMGIPVQSVKSKLVKGGVAGLTKSWYAPDNGHLDQQP